MQIAKKILGRNLNDLSNGDTLLTKQIALRYQVK